MRRKVGWTLACLVGLAMVPASAWADMPTVKFADTTGRAYVGQMVKIDASQSTGDDFAWDRDESDTFLVFDKRAAYKATAPGKYVFRFTASGVVDGKAKMVSGGFILDVEPASGPVPPGPTPPGPIPPTPTPDPPGPTPTPTPVVNGKFWAFYIADASAGVTELRKQTDMKKSEAIDAVAKPLDLVFRWTQSNTTDPEMAAWVTYAKSDKGPGLPCVFFVTPNGKEVGRLAAPDEAAIVAEAKRLKGVK